MTADPNTPAGKADEASTKHLPEHPEITPEEQEEKRREAERRRGERFRRIYEALELRVEAHRDGMLVVSGTFGVGEANHLEPVEDRCPDECGPTRSLSSHR